jgi:transposase
MVSRSEPSTVAPRTKSSTQSGDESLDAPVQAAAGSVVIGVDAHKRTHTFVAVDQVGRKVGEKTLVTTSEGHLSAVEWAAQWPQVLFALEDCRHLTRRLEGDLLRAGHQVVRVPAHLMATVRRSGRQSGKSDPIDALAVARAALREPDLPVACLDGPSREVKLLSDHRRDLVAERTRIQCRLRWHLHELDPALGVPSRGLRRYHVLDTLAEWLQGRDGVVARIAAELVERCRELTIKINALERELERLVRRLAPALLALPDCGVLGAATVLGETAGAQRFRSKDAFARFNGTAPIPVWSGSPKMRLNRGGNRAVNSALHMMAVTQARGVGPGKAYLDKRIENGAGRTEGLRLLRRRISDAVFAALIRDEKIRAAASHDASLPISIGPRAA